MYRLHGGRCLITGVKERLYWYEVTRKDWDLETFERDVDITGPIYPRGFLHRTGL